MKISILGTGIVGECIGSALITKGHQVMMGSRSATNEKATAWVTKNGAEASHGTFGAAAKFGEMIFLCTSGGATIDALKIADPKNFSGKVVIDVTNPLDFSKGMPPSMISSLCNTTSLGEEVQKILPKAKVVKALNTVNAYLMVNALFVNNGDHNLFICGNDIDAKETVKDFLAENFGWIKANIIDVGDITGARGTEMIIPFWVRLWQTLGTPQFNYKIVQ
jgi:8-hydroxy-5-deazaflavin:NADPH oxidoreductase